MNAQINIQRTPRAVLARNVSPSAPSVTLTDAGRRQFALENITHLRALLKLQQEQMADAIELKHTAWQMWQNNADVMVKLAGQRRPDDFDEAEKWANHWRAEYQAQETRFTTAEAQYAQYAQEYALALDLLDDDQLDALWLAEDEAEEESDERKEAMPDEVYDPYSGGPDGLYN